MNRRNRLTTIHPQSREDVDLLRQRSQDQGDRTTPASHPDRSQQDTCPICLTEPPVLNVETNCGHIFCGLYFLQKRNKIQIFDRKF